MIELKKVVWIGLFQLMFLGCYGQTRSAAIFDPDGMETEIGQHERFVRRNVYVSKDVFGNTVIKDGSGRTVKSIEKDIFGNTLIKDGNGRTIKSIEKDIFGNTIVKDGNGHTIKSIEKDIFGNIEIKDGNGHTVKSLEKDIFGNFNVKDGDGHTIISMGKDIFGVFIVKDSDGNTILSLQRDNVSNKLVIRDESGNRMDDYIDEVLYFSDKDNSTDFQIIEQLKDGLRGR